MSIRCNSPYNTEVKGCVPWQKACLFDLTDDPCEMNNIADTRPEILEFLQQKMEVYNVTAVPPVVAKADPLSNPDRWHGWFVPWLDEQPWDDGVPSGPLISDSTV